MSRLNKLLPYPYVNIFENKECISENVSDIQSYVKKTGRPKTIATVIRL